MFSILGVLMYIPYNRVVVYLEKTIIISMLSGSLGDSKMYVALARQGAHLSLRGCQIWRYCTSGVPIGIFLYSVFLTGFKQFIFNSRIPEGYQAFV